MKITIKRNTKMSTKMNNINRKKGRKRLVERMVVIFACAVMVAGMTVGVCNLDSFAAEPKVMLSDYTLNPSEIKPGDAFSLAITLQNTADKKVKNMKVSVLSEDGSILPNGGAGTAYLKEIAATKTAEFTFDMKAVPGLLEKSYKLTVKTEYEDVNGASYAVEDTIYIPITLVTRISVTEVMVASDVKIGDDAEITAVVNNLGDTTVRNVTAYIDGKSIDAQSIYIGNIDPGKSGTIDLLTHTKAVAIDDSDAKATLRIVYEDSLGNAYESKQELHVYVDSTSFENLEVVKESKDSQVNKTLIVVILIVVATVVLLILMIRKHRKKKMLLEDF